MQTTRTIDQSGGWRDDSGFGRRGRIHARPVVLHQSAGRWWGEGASRVESRGRDGFLQHPLHHALHGAGLGCSQGSSRLPEPSVPPLLAHLERPGADTAVLRGENEKDPTTPGEWWGLSLWGEIRRSATLGTSWPTASGCRRRSRARGRPRGWCSRWGRSPARRRRPHSRASRRARCVP